jgi:hypothetical protein
VQSQCLDLAGKISDISSVSSVGSGDLAATIPWRAISDGMPADAADCSMELGCHQRKKAVAISETPKMANARMLERFIVNLMHRAGDEIARSVLQEHCSPLLLSYICTAPTDMSVCVEVSRQFSVLLHGIMDQLECPFMDRLGSTDDWY